MRFEVDAILFDIDGTLVDSTAAVERIWRAWADSHGLDVRQILEVCHGRRSQDTVALFLPDEPDGQQSAAVTELERLELDDLADVVALPGARDLLSSLAMERWAAVTSGSRALMRARLGAAGLPIPRVLVAAEDVMQGKPDPEGYRAAAAALGMNIRRCLVIEDAPAGIAAGRAACAPVLAVATSHDASALGTADAVVPDLTACRVERTADGLTLTIPGDGSIP
ncbi:MAG: HAD family hydrolase [Intrasporangium sp.]|uniref:HAD family hydrolase n=1 Tax=Intrasporangium sp. TaxID=1925024 RepID=UPI00264775D1|nr:HAD family hydrolase [Intrasporangium sp.]MDN5796476.1 HAD family hydrolase [Intrasporangium sp.]